MADRNKYVREYYINANGDWELTNNYMVLQKIFTINGEALFCRHISNDEYKTFLITRATNSKKNIIDVILADEETHNDALDIFISGKNR